MGPQKREQNIFYYSSPEEGGSRRVWQTNVKLFLGFPYRFDNYLVGFNQDPGEVCEYLRELHTVCSQHLSFVLPSTDFAYEIYEPGLEVLKGNNEGSQDV